MLYSGSNRKLMQGSCVAGGDVPLDPHCRSHFPQKIHTCQKTHSLFVSWAVLYQTAGYLPLSTQDFITWLILFSFLLPSILGNFNLRLFIWHSGICTYPRPHPFAYAKNVFLQFPFPLLSINLYLSIKFLPPAYGHPVNSPFL